MLPALLKKVSIIYWLRSLCPISLPAPKGGNYFVNLLIFDIAPAPAPVAVVNVLLLAGFLLVWAALRSKRLEITYETE